MDTQHNTQEENRLMQLADDMAAAATSFNAHGYEVFIRAREQFKESVHEFVTKGKEREWL